MSSYFREFPKVFYNFGDEKVPVLFQDLTKYSDLIETFKDEVSTYIEYEIRDGDRPDTLSQKLYGRPDYDWTFFLMNPLLKETGSPCHSTIYTKESSEIITHIMLLNWM